MLKNRTSKLSAATAAVSILLLVLAWMFLISPRRAEAAALEDNRVSAVAANDGLRATIAQLKVEATTLPQRKAELAMIRQQLPPVADMTRFVRDLDAIAVQSGLSLTAVTPGAPVLVVDPLAPAPAPSPAPSPASSAAAGAGAATVDAAPAGPQLVAVPVTVVVRGDYFEAALFMKKAQTQLQRLMLIGTVIIGQVDPEALLGDPENGHVDVSITGQVYVLLDDASDVTALTTPAVGAAGAPAVTASPSPSTSTTPSVAPSGENR